jgi:F-type H+-transporting ATPase subunit b
MGINALLASAEASNSILIPAIPDLLWGTVSFLILAVLFSKYVLPRFNKVLEERADKIEGGFAKAQAAQEKAQETLSQYTNQLSQARTEASSIRAAADEEKRVIVEGARKEAEEKAQATLKRMAEQIDAEKAQAVTTLQKDVGSLALELASKVVGESLKDDSRARAVIDQYITDLERQAKEAGR